MLPTFIVPSGFEPLCCNECERITLGACLPQQLDQPGVTTQVRKDAQLNLAVVCTDQHAALWGNEGIADVDNNIHAACVRAGSASPVAIACCRLQGVLGDGLEVGGAGREPACGSLCLIPEGVGWHALWTTWMAIIASTPRQHTVSL